MLRMALPLGLRVAIMFVSVATQATGLLVRAKPASENTTQAQADPVPNVTPVPTMIPAGPAFQTPPAPPPLPHMKTLGHVKAYMLPKLGPLGSTQMPLPPQPTAHPLVPGLVRHVGKETPGVGADVAGKLPCGGQVTFEPGQTPGHWVRVCSGSPVHQFTSASGFTTLLSAALAGSTELAIESTAGFAVGMNVVIDGGTKMEEHNTIVGFGSILLGSPLKFDHPPGATVKAGPRDILPRLAPGSPAPAPEMPAPDSPPMFEISAANATLPLEMQPRAEINATQPLMEINMTQAEFSPPASNASDDSGMVDQLPPPVPAPKFLAPKAVPVRRNGSIDSSLEAGSLDRLRQLARAGVPSKVTAQAPNRTQMQGVPAPMGLLPNTTSQATPLGQTQGVTPPIGLVPNASLPALNLTQKQGVLPNAKLPNATLPSLNITQTQGAVPNATVLPAAPNATVLPADPNATVQPLNQSQTQGVLPNTSSFLTSYEEHLLSKYSTLYAPDAS